MTNRSIIVDIDGTIADLSHRLHHISSGHHKNWDAFFAGVSQDTPIMETLHTIESIMEREEPPHLFFVSGRPEKTRKATESWIAEWAWFLMKHDDAGLINLLMRPDNDTRPDFVVKEEILDNILGQGYVVEMVFDDRPSVIEMWKRRGLHVFQVHAAGAVPVHDETKATLHLLVGPTHAGKTTGYPDHIKDRHVYLSSDALRYYISGNDADQSRNDEVFALLHTLTRTYLQAGVNVVYDATNIRRKDRIAAASLSNGGPVIYHVFNRQLADKLESRRFAFPEQVIIKHEQTFQSQLKDILSGDNLPNVTVEDHREPRST